MTPPPDELELTEDLEQEYNFRSLQGVIRGKYAGQYQERLRIVRLAADVSEAFADEVAVNVALREYLKGQQERGAANSA